MRIKILFVLKMLAWLLLALSTITSIFRYVGLDAKLYYKLQMRENVPVTADISEEDLLHLDNKMSLYLRGMGSLDAADDESLIISVNGVMQPAFNEREIQHMQDCQRLFELLMDAGLTCKLLFWIVLLVTGFAEYLFCGPVKKWDESLPKALWLGSGTILVPLAIFALWAAIDFSSAFTLFHKLLFTNDLWLLDPRTDLLINICPASMFANMGLRIGLWAAAALLGVPALITALNRISEKRKRKQHEVSDL